MPLKKGRKILHKVKLEQTMGRGEDASEWGGKEWESDGLP